MERHILAKRKYAVAGVSVASVILIQFVLSACQQTVQGPKSIPPAERSNPILPEPSPDASPTPPAKGEHKTVAYRVVSGNEGAHLEKVDVTGDADASSPALSAINLMAALPDSPLPKGTKARSMKVEGDLATIDFNKAFASNFEGGDEREALMLNAITATLGQFPNVKRVQLLVEGQKQQIGGMQDTTEPLDVPPSITQVSQKTDGASTTGDR